MWGLNLHFSGRTGAGEGEERAGEGAGMSSLWICAAVPQGGVYGELVSQPLLPVLMCVFSRLPIV